jgi:hypothetical protein
MSQLVRNNAISTSTGYDRLHEGEGIAVLAPGLLCDTQRRTYDLFELHRYAPTRRPTVM